MQQISLLNAMWYHLNFPVLTDNMDVASFVVCDTFSYKSFFRILHSFYSLLWGITRIAQ